MIIPVFRVVTTQFPIAASTTIEAGMVVTLNATTGYAEKCDKGDVPVGLAADRNRASESYEWVNRVSDSGNDTAASGMLSVYCGGGEFYVDVNDSKVTTPNGSAITGVIVSDCVIAPMEKLYTAASGQLDDTAGGATIVAICLENAAALDAGIPGEYEPNSVAMVDDTLPRTWVKIKLVV